MEQLVKALINNHHEIELSPNTSIDIKKQADSNSYHVIHNNKSYRVTLLDVDRQKKHVHFTINDVPYQVDYKDQVDVTVDEMGLSTITINEATDALAPMPGLVLSVSVSAGDQVEEGQALLILEAMKMENVIKASSAVVVKEVLVGDGDKVEKGQVLVTFEE